MFAPLQPTPAPPRPAYIPPRPWSGALRAAVAAPAPKPAAPAPAPKPAAPTLAPKPAAPAPTLLAAVPEVLAPAVAALAHAAQQQAPYQLLAQALGHDPLTGNAVPAAPLALARSLVGLLPDGPARFQQLQAAGPALAQLPAWLAHQLAAHQLTGPRLTQVLTQTGTQLRALGLRDALDPAPALARLTQPWLALGQDVARFVLRTEAALLRWLLAAVLGPDHAAPVLRALDQGGDLLLRILRHPLPFLTNLVAAGKRGFAAFLANGPRHLLAAVQDWLLGGLAKAGLLLPARLDLAGLLDVLLQVFDLTKAAVLRRLRLRLPTLPTERLQQVLTQVGGVALTLWQHGPQAAWQAISAHAQGLRAQALDLVQQQVLAVAAKAVPLFLASLAVPGGAFVQLARGLYNGVMLFVEKGRQLAQVGQALFASAAAIAAGQLAPAAQAVENTLVKILPVALNFLGRQLGLDGISGAIQTGLKKVQVPVEKAVNRVLDIVADKAKTLWSTLKAGTSKAVDKGKQVATTVGTTVKGWLGFRQQFTLPNHEKHTLFFREDGRLMVASTPQPYTSYLDKLATHVAVANPELQVKYAAAYKLADDIAEWEKVNGKQATLPVDIQQKLATLAHLTLDLMQLDPAMGAPNQVVADTKAEYTGLLTTANFGLGMHVHYLSYSAVQGGLSAPSGSSPYGHGVNDTFDALNQRRWNESTANYYARGHLLSEKLNGPGKALENIVPLSRTGNRLHEEQVESTLKKAAGRDAVTRAFAYSVVPRYGRPLDKTLQTYALGLGTAAGRIWARIIEAEQYVPLNLVCTFTEIDAKTRQPVANGLSLHQIVDNPVDQAATAYVNNAVTTATTTVYNFGGKHPAVNINDVDRASKLEDIGFSAGDARDVLNATVSFVDKKAVYAFKSTAAWQASVKRAFDRGELKVG